MLLSGDRRALRGYFLDAWRKRCAGAELEPLEALIADVVGEHPEYHELLARDASLEREFSPLAGPGNPFLHMGMHIALREQVATDRPPGIAVVHARLSARLGDAGAAEHRMMECLGETLWRAQREQRLPDEAAYLECLRRL